MMPQTAFSLSPPCPKESRLCQMLSLLRQEPGIALPRAQVRFAQQDEPRRPCQEQLLVRLFLFVMHPQSLSLWCLSAHYSNPCSVPKCIEPPSTAQPFQYNRMEYGPVKEREEDLGVVFLESVLQYDSHDLVVILRSRWHPGS